MEVGRGEEEEEWAEEDTEERGSEAAKEEEVSHEERPLLDDGQTTRELEHDRKRKEATMVVESLALADDGSKDKTPTPFDEDVHHTGSSPEGSRPSYSTVERETMKDCDGNSEGREKETFNEETQETADEQV